MTKTAKSLASALLDMTITVRRDKVYGKVVYYPKCSRAYYFAQIAGTKTLSVENLERIKIIGFAIEEVS